MDRAINGKRGCKCPSLVRLCDPSYKHKIIYRIDLLESQQPNNCVSEYVWNPQQIERTEIRLKRDIEKCSEKLQVFSSSEEVTSRTHAVSSRHVTSRIIKTQLY